MVNRRGGFSLFRGIHVRNDVRIGISISIRAATTKFGDEVQLQELTQNETDQACADDVITSRSQLHLDYGHQTLTGW